MIAARRVHCYHPISGGMARGGRSSGGGFHDGVACWRDSVDYATTCTSNAPERDGRPKARVLVRLPSSNGNGNRLIR